MVAKHHVPNCNEDTFWIVHNSDSGYFPKVAAAEVLGIVFRANPILKQWKAIPHTKVEIGTTDDRKINLLYLIIQETPVFLSWNHWCDQKKGKNTSTTNSSICRIDRINFLRADGETTNYHLIEMFHQANNYRPLCERETFLRRKGGAESTREAELMCCQLDS